MPFCHIVSQLQEAKTNGQMDNVFYISQSYVLDNSAPIAASTSFLRDVFPSAVCCTVRIYQQMDKQFPRIIPEVGEVGVYPSVRMELLVGHKR